MTLANKIIEFKLAFANGLSFLMETVATKIFNYPNVAGMPINPNYDTKKQAIVDYVSKLPVHTTNFPVPAAPETLSQVFFGNFPMMMTINRTFYEHKSDGFYNFYVPNYQNIFFLPDWLSQWIQINFEISVDTTPLEIIQRSLFLGLVGFFFIVEFRMKLYWFLTINPYTRPWIYLISFTDWVQELMTGLSPVLLGIDLTAPVVLGLTGKFADSLNHLIFTMPFLPSEGQPGKMLINDEIQDVILFRYLPSLWYTHPIPDKLREFWYFERKEIFDFMQKNYGHLDIEFVPNQILKQMYEQQHITNSLVENGRILKGFSTTLISTTSSNLINVFNNSSAILTNLSIIDIDKFIT